MCMCMPKGGRRLAHHTPLLKIPVWWRRAVLPSLPWVVRFLHTPRTGSDCVLVRELRPQGREPWCTGSQGSAPLSQATPLEAARINLKRFPPDRCQFVTPPSYPLAKLPSRQGASHWCGHAPRWPRQMAMRATPGWLGITPLPRPSGESCLSQAGEFACPWASTEFPDLASRRAPSPCPVCR